MTGYGTGQVQLTAVVTAALQAKQTLQRRLHTTRNRSRSKGRQTRGHWGRWLCHHIFCVATFSFAEIKPFRISNYWGELGGYFDILKRSVGRLSERGHAG